MAPRGRKKKGLMRDDAARDAMMDYGFETRLINETIKELLELYNEENANPWKLIEEGGYAILLDRLLEKQAERENQLASHNEELAVEEQAEQENQLAAEEQAEPTQEDGKEEENEQESYVEEGRDQIGSSSTAPKIGSSSTALLGYGADIGAQTCQTDALSVTNEAVIDSVPANFQPGVATPNSVGVTIEAVMDSSPAAFQSADSVGGNQSSHCGWLSSEDESDAEKDGDDNDNDDDDEEMIQLTPEPLCEELKNLLADIIRRERKRKRPSRWDT